MNRYYNRAIIGLLTGLGTIMLSSEANAQFLPFQGGNPFTSRSVYTRNVSLFYSTPFGGYSLSFRNTYRTQYSTPYPVIATPGLTYRGTAVNPLLYGSSSFANTAAWDQHTLNLQRAQRANRVDPNGKQVAFDKWVDQKGAKGVPAEKLAALDPDVRIALEAPLDLDILSGKALNRAVKAILALEAKRAEAKPPFFTPDTLDKIIYQGGPHADTLNFLQGTIQLPSGASNPQIEAARMVVLKDAAAILENVKSGKRPELAQFEKLSAESRKLHDLYVAAGNSEVLIRFLNRLESALFAATDRANEGLIVATWHNIGVSASDLAKHMGKYKLEFAPASPDDEGAYFALHRGLVVYLSELANSR